ncbi:MAG: 2-deoxystreptamine glucosyltransferase [Chloroflexi bacterium ADurb.Bin325]|nr:MAG: 2-deoxystreptamine glucosyltransferase [Chloroflexi bacterium ADurb.Bin325]
MTRPRILQLVTGIAIGEQSGGAEQVALHVALRLDPAAFERAVFVMRRYGSPAEAAWHARLAAAQVVVFGFGPPANGERAELQRIWRDLWACVSAFRPDVINSHSERGDALNVLVRLLHPAHPCAIRTMHTDQQWQTRPWTGRLFAQAVFPLACAREIAVSQAVRDVLERRPLARLLRKKSPLCYPAIDSAGLREAREARARLRHDGGSAAALPPGAPSGRPRVGIVGRLMPQKGHAFLLQAVARLAEAHPIDLLVVGSGPLDADLQAQAAALGIAERVHFLGHRRDVAAILAHLDLLVSASLWEGLPGAVLEAMVVGVPVIATDVSGSREVVLPGQTGLLAPPGRGDALADALAYAIGHPADMEAMARRAAELVGRFSVEEMAQAYAAVYRQALAGRQAG